MGAVCLKGLQTDSESHRGTDREWSRAESSLTKTDEEALGIYCLAISPGVDSEEKMQRLAVPLSHVLVMRAAPFSSLTSLVTCAIASERPVVGLFVVFCWAAFVYR